MLISLNWIKEFVELPNISARNLAEALTLATAEVEACTNVGTDTVLEIDNKSLTHRPDLWGHYGFAREFSTIYRTPLKDPCDQAWANRLTGLFSAKNSPIVPEVEEESACLGYFGISLDSITVQPSPAWMQERLIALGLRPINNLVDIGNYVMLELGIPMHIFDRTKITGNKLVIHALKEASQLNLLDGTQVQLLPGDTVVADSSGPLVLAGIMGGISSGVTDKTSNILIEVANWQPALVRRTSTRLGVRTDSSIRYEKSLDTNQLERTLLRAIDLVLQFCPKATIVGKIERDGVVASKKTTEITTTFKRINEILGREVDEKEATDILKYLGFSTTTIGTKLSVSVPTIRATKDIQGEADIIEEIGRIVGYNNIPAKAPLNEVKPVRLSHIKKLERQLRELCVLHGKGLEVMTYPLLGMSLLKASNWPNSNDDLRLVNAWSTDFDRMRPSLVPSLLQTLALNQKYHESFRFFEIGRAYLSSARDFSIENIQLGFVLFDRSASKYPDALDLTEQIMRNLRIKTKFGPYQSNPTCLDSSWQGIHPNQIQGIFSANRLLGATFTFHPGILKSFKIRGQASCILLSLNELVEFFKVDDRKYKQIPKNPSTYFDTTVKLAVQVEVARPLDSIVNLANPAILSVKILSIFKMPSGELALTIRTSVGHPEKTLDGDEIKSIEREVIDVLASSGYPLKK